jgi:hypothetical protein
MRSMISALSAPPQSRESVTGSWPVAARTSHLITECLLPGRPHGARMTGDLIDVGPLIRTGNAPEHGAR